MVEKNGVVLAVSGKGGTGKTFVSTMLVRNFAKLGSLDILAMDADPDSNFAEALGQNVERGIGDIREEILKSDNMPPDVTKDVLLESGIFEIMNETDDFDLVTMGRSEGSGCYCAINHILRNVIDRLSKGYDVTIIDCEAGLEHLSRRTTRSVDIMLVVTDPNRNGLLTAKRIKNLADEVSIVFKHTLLVANKIDPELLPYFNKTAEELGLEIAGYIPDDSLVAEYNLAGKPIIDLPDDAPSVQAFEKMFDMVLEKIREV